VSDAEFEGIFRRVKANGIPYASGPDHHADGQKLVLYSFNPGKQVLAFFFSHEI